MRIQALAARTQGGILEPWSYEISGLGPAELLVRVRACGICHSDIHMIDNDWRMTTYPIVPGHEVVGEVVEAGAHVEGFAPGDRVGIGWQRTSCGNCSECDQGADNLCDGNRGLIVGHHGGFADHVVCDARYCFPIPDGIATESAGPLMCGGITVWSALRYAGMKGGQEIGIIGIGGLGHLAVQFAQKLGNRVTVFTTSEDKLEFAARLGAWDAIRTQDGEPTRSPRRKFDILVNTVPVNLNWAKYLELLAADGTLTFVGVPGEPSAIPVHLLLGKRRRVMASVIGSRGDIRRMLSDADRFEVEPIVETFPMSRVNEAIVKVRENTIRYRAVLLAS